MPGPTSPGEPAPDGATAQNAGDVCCPVAAWLEGVEDDFQERLAGEQFR